LRSGKLDEALVEYQKAIDAKMWLANSGVATVKLIKGDFAGARTAMDAAYSGAVQPQDKVDALYWKSCAFMAENKLADAVKTVDQIEKEAQAANVEMWAAIAPIARGDFYMAAGKSADALKQYALAEKAKTDRVADGMKRRLTVWRREGVIDADASSGKIPDAEKQLGELEELMKATPGDAEAMDSVYRARGLVAIAKKDFKGAVETLSKCTERHDRCKLNLADAQEKAGDGAAAAATRKALLEANHRDPGYWIARSKLAAASKPAAAGAPKK
jgi:tetratricopeptide (TPR) repeat protein